MCARLIPHQPAGSRSSLNGSKGSPADVNFSSSASYRVLRSGRQRPWRSVNREIVGRNENEAIEPRQIFRVWTPSFYDYGEGNILRLFGAWESTGVQENSMLSRLMKSEQDQSCSAREPRKSRASQVETEIEVLTQGSYLKSARNPTLEVRWRNSSKEVG
jgi:hypothetical protein